MSTQLPPPSLSEDKITAIPVEPAEDKLTATREAMSDPLFLADLQEVAKDFQHVDVDTEIENYWADANIDDIHARVMQWKKQ